MLQLVTVCSLAKKTPPDEVRATPADRASRPTIALTRALLWFTIITPMARNLTAETSLQGQTLSGFGAYACQPGMGLDHEAKPGRRGSANTGSPVVRW